MGKLATMDQPEKRAVADEQALVERLRRGDEAAFVELLDRHAASMLRLALVYCPSRAMAEEVVQDTWLVVISGLERFEGRSSLKGWIFGILSNKARTRGVRELRTVPFASLAGAEDINGASVDADRFLPVDDEREPRHWATPPRRWEDSPERSLASAHTTQMVREAVDGLRPTQRLVITMRDLEGWEAHEVCDALAISENHQRVLLHRARVKVRAALERYFHEDLHA